MPSWTYVLGHGTISDIVYIKRGFELLPIIVLVVILDGQEGVSEDVNERHSYRRAKPAVTGMMHRMFPIVSLSDFPNCEQRKRGWGVGGRQTFKELFKKTFTQCSLIIVTHPRMWPLHPLLSTFGYVWMTEIKKTVPQSNLRQSKQSRLPRPSAQNSFNLCLQFEENWMQKRQKHISLTIIMTNTNTGGKPNAKKHKNTYH